MRLFGTLTKIEDQPDGTLKVYGVASTGARDDAGEIVLPEAMKAALPDYARYPALREMHQPTAAGRTLEADVDDDGATRIVAHVVDPVAIAKVKSRTYSGFSIGGRVLARDPADATVITKIRLSEISLVDRPANPEAVIDLWKADAAGAPPSNEAVKTLAAEMASAAGRPRAWKDYVAKARAALTAEPDQSAMADSDDPDADDTSDAGPDDSNASDDAADPTPDADAPDNDDALTPAELIARLAELAAADPDALQAAHDALAGLGAACDPDNCPDADAELDKSSDAADLARLGAGRRPVRSQHRNRRLHHQLRPERPAAEGELHLRLSVHRLEPQLHQPADGRQRHLLGAVGEQVPRLRRRRPLALPQLPGRAVPEAVAAAQARRLHPAAARHERPGQRLGQCLQLLDDGVIPWRMSRSAGRCDRSPCPTSRS
jgi:phage head maturation protease